MNQWGAGCVCRWGGVVVVAAPNEPRTMWPLSRETKMKSDGASLISPSVTNSGLSGEFCGGEGVCLFQHTWFRSWTRHDLFKYHRHKTCGSFKSHLVLVGETGRAPNIPGAKATQLFVKASGGDLIQPTCTQSCRAGLGRRPTSWCLSVS